MDATSTVVLDNGGSTVKAGVVGTHPDPLLVPNAVVRSKGDKKNYVGHEYAQCSDYSSLHFRLPLEKGLVTDWDAQKAVWDVIFSEDLLKLDTQQSSLLLTEPYFNLPNLQSTYDQFIFEEYEFKSYCRRTPASCVPYGSLFAQPDSPPPECTLILDCGFSFSHVVPVINGHVQWKAVRRVDVGGKLLTNHLKELVSFRQWNMMDQTAVINHVKETCCFVSLDFAKDLERARQGSSKPIEYVLPDLTQSPHGHLKSANAMDLDNSQVLLMGNERFSVPELLFTPSDIGLEQAGIAHAVAASISALPEDLRGMFWANIGLVGGSTRFSGFKQRLMLELERLAPTDCEVVIYESDDPTTAAYHGAYAFASSPDFPQHVITRAEYLEQGSRRHDDCWRPVGEAQTPGRGRVRQQDGRERQVQNGRARQADDERSTTDGGSGSERSSSSSSEEPERPARGRRKSLKGESSRTQQGTQPSGPVRRRGRPPKHAGPT